MCTWKSRSATPSREGRAMVNAARDTGKVVQVGTHRRVSPHNVSRHASFSSAGKAGKIGMVRAFVHYGGGPGEAATERRAAEGAELGHVVRAGAAAALQRRTGQLKTPGVAPSIHGVSAITSTTPTARSATGAFTGWIRFSGGPDEKWPKQISSIGGRHIKGPAVSRTKEQTTRRARPCRSRSFEFESFTAVWEHRQFAGNNAEKGENVGCYFYGTERHVPHGLAERLDVLPYQRERSRSIMKTRSSTSPTRRTSRSFCRFLGCDQDESEAGERHRRGSPLHQHELARHALAEARPQPPMGRRKGTDHR